MSTWTETAEPEGEPLLRGTDRDVAPDEIRRRVLPRLAAGISAMCTWGRLGRDCIPGDVRFMVIEFSVSPNIGFYVQILTEPDEVVLAEAVSPAWHPELHGRIGPPQRRALRALGYRVGGAARNFQKEWTVGSPREARALANGLLDILIDVFGYRGRQPLIVHRHSDTRCSTDKVYLGMGAGDVRKILRAMGCEVALLDRGRLPAGMPRDLPARTVIVERPIPFSVVLEPRVARGSDACQLAAFSSELEGTEAVSDAAAVAASRFVRLGRLARNPDGNLALLLDLPLVGITMEGFVRSVRGWFDVRRATLRMLQSARGSSGGHRAPARTACSGHRRPRNPRRGPS